MRLSALCLCFALLVVSAVQAQQLIGYKMVERRTIMGRSNDETIYFAGDRQRREVQSSLDRRLPDGSMQVETVRRAFISRCDTKQVLDLNLDDSEYEEAPFQPFPGTRQIHQDHLGAGCLPLGEPPGKGHHGEGCDEWLEPQVRDRDA